MILQCWDFWGKVCWKRCGELRVAWCLLNCGCNDSRTFLQTMTCLRSPENTSRSPWIHAWSLLKWQRYDSRHLKIGCHAWRKNGLTDTYNVPSWNSAQPRARYSKWVAVGCGIFQTSRNIVSIFPEFKGFCRSRPSMWALLTTAAPLAAHTSPAIQTWWVCTLLHSDNSSCGLARLRTWWFW